MLTKKQKNLLLFINKKIRGTGVSPSYEEMKSSLNLKSKSGMLCFSRLRFNLTHISSQISLLKFRFKSLLGQVC